MNRNEFININSISIHHKPKKISKTWKLKVNSVVHKACSKGFYLRNRLKNALLILQNLYLAQPIFKIGSLNLFSTEPNFCYCEILKFQRPVNGINFWNKTFLKQKFAWLLKKHRPILCIFKKNIEGRRNWLAEMM